MLACGLTNMYLSESPKHFSVGAGLSLLSTIFIINGALAIKTQPTALDVYQGKTELRITYDGNVPVDSVVIFKKK